jgi:two-component system cell cycle sensor histidine kinase/response regulator CckA
MSERLHVLVVEDNQGDVGLIREALSDTGFVNFQIESVSRLSEALARLKNAGIDLVLLDLGLPDSNGLETFYRMLEATPHIPIIILTGNDNQEMAVLAVREGAQDYLIKGQIGGIQLTRAVRYAMERKRLENELRKSEEQLRDIIFSIADWVWEVDENGVYTYSSRKGFDLFGKSRKDVIGKTPFDFMLPDEAKRVAAIFSEIVTNKAPIKCPYWTIRGISKVTEV